MKIGIAISGGGYRATTFSLGTFSYLHQIQFENDTLLQKVVALSTVSGGSITGITYAQSVKDKVPFLEYYKEMYRKITTFDLVKSSINNFSDPSNPNSLIEGFSQSYFDYFLDKKDFGSILPNKNQLGQFDTHLLYNCINATDFNTGTPFRFIAQTDWKNPKAPFVFGNAFFRLNRNLNKIPLQTALAASSCFPGGFEPIIFDISDYQKVDSKQLIDKVSLMDGGIVDNQGIDSILNYHKKNPLDIVIVIDSSSPRFTRFDPSKKGEIRFIGNFKLINITYIIFILNIIALFGVCFSYNKHAFLTIIFTVLTAYLSVISFGLLKMRKLVSGLIVNNYFDKKSFKPLNNITPNAIVQLLSNRFKSMELLIGSVFMKHLRRKNTRDLFAEKSLSRKSIVTLIYQLKKITSEEKFVKMNGLSIPDRDKSGFEFDKSTKGLDLISKISENAFSMKTTLWVENSVKGENLIKDVLVTAQITMCANLVNYYCKNDFENPIYLQAREDWNQFMKDPYWLLAKQGL